MAAVVRNLNVNTFQNRYNIFRNMIFLTMLYLLYYQLKRTRLTSMFAYCQVIQYTLFEPVAKISP